MSTTPSGCVILFVDDEEQARKYFQRALKKYYTVRTADGVAAAKEIVAELGDDLGVVVTDQRMPRQTGVDLLAWLRNERPSVVRLLTTAYADLDDAVDAVNDGSIFHYIHKPWDVKELRGIVRRAVDYFTVQRERDLLLREKLTTLQRMIVVDRVRSFAVLAAGLGNRLRNSLLALKTFLDVAPEAGTEERSTSAGGMRWDDVWDLARAESDRMLDLVAQVVSVTTEPAFHFDAQCSPQDLVAAVEWPGEPPKADCADSLAPLRCDRAMIGRTLGLLAGILGSIRPGQRPVLTVDACDAVWGAPGWRIRLTIHGDTFTHADVERIFSVLTPLEAGAAAAEDRGSDLLAAYFAVFHHGGTLSVTRESTHGAGFEVQLPLDPDASEQPAPDRDWVNGIFALFET